MATRERAAPSGDYGVDAPYVLYSLAGAAVVAAAAAIIAFTVFESPQPGLAITAIVLALSASSYLYTTRRGKFAVWTELLDSLAMRGDERLLDVGCGRGAVLLLAARRLPEGHAVGVDLWSTKDQSGNSERVTRQNAKLQGVQERVELHTADMRKLPLPDRVRTPRWLRALHVRHERFCPRVRRIAARSPGSRRHPRCHRPPELSARSRGPGPPAPRSAREPRDEERGHRAANER